MISAIMDSIEVQVRNPRTGRIDYRFRQTSEGEVARLAAAMRVKGTKT